MSTEHHSSLSGKTTCSSEFKEPRRIGYLVRNQDQSQYWSLTGFMAFKDCFESIYDHETQPALRDWLEPHNTICKERLGHEEQNLAGNEELAKFFIYYDKTYLSQDDDDVFEDGALSDSMVQAIGIRNYFAKDFNEEGGLEERTTRYNAILSVCVTELEQKICRLSLKMDRMRAQAISFQGRRLTRRYSRKLDEIKNDVVHLLNLSNNAPIYDLLRPQQLLVKYLRSESNFRDADLMSHLMESLLVAEQESLITLDVRKIEGLASLLEKADFRTVRRENTTNT